MPMMKKYCVALCDTDLMGCHTTEYRVHQEDNMFQPFGDILGKFKTREEAYNLIKSLEVMSIAEESKQMLKEGRKDDSEKLRYDLVPPFALSEVVRVFNYGARKYEARNWERGILWMRLFAAIMRHAWAWASGETNDTETDINHMAHVACSALMLIEYTNPKMSKENFDDRNNYSKK